MWKTIKQNLSLIILSVFIVLIIYFISPLYSAAKENSHILNQKKAELEYVQQNKAAATDNTDLIKERLVALDNLFIKRQDALDFITTLEDIAAKLDLPEPEKNIPASQIEAGDTNIPIQISVNGSFEQAMQFIDELEKCQYLIDPYEIKMSKASSGESTTYIKTQILATTYWQ